MKIQPIDKELTVQKIYQSLYDSILSGDLKPGDMLPSEEHLAESFNVGRGTVREAKKMFTAVGVFEERRGHGTFVATKVKPPMFNPLLFSLIIEENDPNNNNPDKVKDLYELRIMFEKSAMELIIDQASDDDILKVKKCVDDCKQALKDGVSDANYYLEQEYLFHSQIYEITGNPLIARIGNVINELFRQGMMNCLSEKHTMESCVNNHYNICVSLYNRDKEAVKKAVVESLDIWRNHLEK